MSTPRQRPRESEGDGGTASPVAIWTRLLGDAAPSRPPPGSGHGGGSVSGRTDDDGESKASEVNRPVVVPVTPAARSGHAMTLLVPTESVLLFGGADGRVFYEDFYVLEPAHYATMDMSAQYSDSPTTTAAAALTTSSRAKSSAQAGVSPSTEQGERPGLQDGATEQLQFQWKKLVVTYAPARHASPCVALSASSMRSSVSQSQSVSPHAGCGRDYHTMHYVRESQSEERSRGLRVLVVGNVVIAADDRSGGGALTFEMQELRVEEVRIHQATMEAQWVSRRVDSMWKPRARHAHASVMVGDQQLFCFGGKTATSSMYFNDLFYFDTALCQWKKPAVAGMAPAARAFSSMAVSDAQDKIFLYGGTDGKEDFGALFVYDVAVSRWDTLTGATGDRPSCRINHSLTFVAPNHLIVFGGRQRAKRQNQLFIFDIDTRKWRLVHGRGAQSSSESTDNIERDSSSQSEQPVGRTAHAAVLYDSSRIRDRLRLSRSHSRMLIFGGYAGSHRWLDDLYLLSLPGSADLMRRGERLETRPSTNVTIDVSTNVAAASQNPETDLDNLSQCDPDVTDSQDISLEPSTQPLVRHPPQEQQEQEQDQEQVEPGHLLLSQQHEEQQASQRRSSSRSESQSSTSVLSDITNQPIVNYQAPQSGRQQATSKRGLKRRRLDDQIHLSQESAGGGNGSNSSGNSGSNSTVLSRANIGLQTTMLQILQRQGDLEEGFLRLESQLSKAKSIRLQEDSSNWHDSFLLTQNQTLHQRLYSLQQKCEVLEETLRQAEQDKAELREQLAARDTELYVCKRNLEDLMLPLGHRVRAIEESSRKHAATAQMIESKISSVHDILDEIRHAGGDGTETEDSPEKRDRLGSSPYVPTTSKTSSTSGRGVQSSPPPILYPSRVVVALEERLRVAQMEKETLSAQLKEAHAKLQLAEEKERHTRTFFAAWFQQDPPPPSITGEEAGIAPP